MGTRNQFTANFRSGMRKFGNFVKKAGLFVGVALLMLILVVVWVLVNMVTLLTAPVWMPVAFIFTPQWLAKRLKQPTKDEPEEFLTDYLIGASKLFGWFFIWLGTRSWMLSRILNPFIQESERSLKDYPLKKQILYWSWCSYKNNCFKYGLSEEAREVVIKYLLNSGNIDAIKDIADDCGDDKFNLLNTLVSVAEKENSLTIETKVIEVLNSYYYADWRYYKLSDDSIDYLLNLMNENLTCGIILADGLNIKRTNWLLSQGKFGINIISEYAKSKTFSNEVIALLIKKLVNDDSQELRMILSKSIIKNGLDAKLLSDFYRTNDSGVLKQFVDDCMTAYADRCMVKGTSDEDEGVKAYRWKLYCNQQHSIHLEAQAEMNYERYKTFKRCGHKLHPEVLRYFLININDKYFFKFLINEEWDDIFKNDELIRLIKATSWKHAIYVDVFAEKMCGEA